MNNQFLAYHCFQIKTWHALYKTVLLEQMVSLGKDEILTSLTLVSYFTEQHWEIQNFMKHLFRACQNYLLRKASWLKASLN